MKKKLLVGLLALTLIASQTSFSPQTANAALKDDIKDSIVAGGEVVKDTIVTAVKKFKDTVGHWAEASINKAINSGYVNGYTDGTFRPNNQINRAEFIKMIVTSLDLEVKDASGIWYTPYVNTAQTTGLYKSGDFKDSNWTKAMTREEMSKVAVRAIGITDAESKEWMYLATKKGLITGTAPGVISPEGTTTRAQAIAVIERVMSVKNGKTLTVDKYAVSSAEIYWHKTNIFSVMPEVFNTPLPNRLDTPVEKQWRDDGLVIETDDKKWKGELEALIAINLADPNDPNLKLLGNDYKKLKWFNNTGSNKELNGDIIPLMNLDVYPKWKDSWVLYFKTKTHYNKNTKQYGPNLAYSIRGTVSSNYDAYYNGTLNGLAGVYNKSLNDLPAKILPKKGWKQDGDLSILIYAPTYSNYTGVKINTLLTVAGPQPSK